MADTNVLIVNCADPDNPDDLLFLMIAKADNGWGMISRVHRIEGECADGAARGRGNPYGVYGDTVEGFVGCPKLQTSITVFENRSGDLRHWKGHENT